MCWGCAKSTKKNLLCFLLDLIQQKLSSYVQLVVQDCLQSVSGQTWIRVTESSTAATTNGINAMHILIPVNVFVVDTYPAWIVGLRGLWPSTKIWLSPPETTSSQFGCEHEKNKNGLNWPKKVENLGRRITLKRMAMPVEVRTTQCWEMLIPLWISLSFLCPSLVKVCFPLFLYFGFCLDSVAFLFLPLLPFIQNIIIFHLLFHPYFFLYFPSFVFDIFNPAILSASLPHCLFIL